MISGIDRNSWEKIGRLVPSLNRDNVHEVIATVRAIGAVLKSDGLDWHDFGREVEGIGRPIICTPPSAAPTWCPTCSRSPSAARSPSFGDLARACRDLDRGRLAQHERQFVSDMCRRGFSFRPSPRQLAWLSDIFDKLNERAAA